jgi:hypothetical protein
MDDRPLPWRLLTECRNGLEETRFGGFLVASQKRLVDSDASWGFPLLARFASCYGQHPPRRGHHQALGPSDRSGWLELLGRTPSYGKGPILEIQERL